MRKRAWLTFSKDLEHVVQAIRDRPERHGPCACRRELERHRNPIEPPYDPRDRLRVGLGQNESRIDIVCAVDEELRRLAFAELLGADSVRRGQAERLEGIHGFPAQPESCPARRDHPELGREPKQSLDRTCSSLLDVLTVVDQDQRIEFAERGVDSFGSDAQRLGDLGFHSVRTDRCKLHEPYAIGVAAEPSVPELERGTRFARTANSVKREQPGLTDELVELVELLAPANEGADRIGKVGPRRGGSRLVALGSVERTQTPGEVGEELVCAADLDEVPTTLRHDPGCAALRRAPACPVGRKSVARAPLQGFDQGGVPLA